MIDLTESGKITRYKFVAITTHDYLDPTEVPTTTSHSSPATSKAIKVSAMTTSMSKHLVLFCLNLYFIVHTPTDKFSYSLHYGHFFSPLHY